jgi:hypothetical protein
VPSGEQVTVPAQDGGGANQQPDAAQYVAGQLVQQRGEECPVGRVEADLLAMQLPFEEGELMPKSQDLCVLGPVGHGQQTEHRKRVGYAEVRQSQKHRAILAQ